MSAQGEQMRVSRALCCPGSMGGVPSASRAVPEPAAAGRWPNQCGVFRFFSVTWRWPGRIIGRTEQRMVPLIPGLSTTLVTLTSPRPG